MPRKTHHTCGVARQSLLIQKSSLFLKFFESSGWLKFSRYQARCQDCNEKIPLHEERLYPYVDSQHCMLLYDQCFQPEAKKKNVQYIVKFNH